MNICVMPVVGAGNTSLYDWMDCSFPVKVIGNIHDKEEGMKYRKKPVEIEAFKYDGDLMGSDGKYYVPDWAVKALENWGMYYDYIDGNPPELFIRTLEGVHHVSVGDYIIQGVKGELYPCKPDIFEMTYEEVK